MKYATSATLSPLLQHEIGALQILGEKIYMGEPGILAVEFISKPSVYTGDFSLHMAA